MNGHFSKSAYTSIFFKLMLFKRVMRSSTINKLVLPLDNVTDAAAQMELPGMTENLLGEEEPEYEQKRFQPVVNLDIFFKQMYKYHYNRGLPGVILTQFCNMVSLGFTVAFSVFVLAFIDWPSLMDCHDEQSCHNLNYYVTSRHVGFSSLFGFIVLGYSVLFCAYWVYRCGLALRNISQAIEMERFYREKLGINLKILETISWNDVVQRLIKLHEHKIYRVAVKDRLTEHDVVSRVMRKENYMIALINKGVMDLRLPWWASTFFGSDKLFLTKSLESSLYYCILMHIFNDQFNVSSVFLRDIKGLQSRFVAFGAAHFLLLPFMLIFFSVNFFLENAQQFHSSKSYLGPRQWSPLAIWKFREFNEMLHVFEKRINKSYEPANAYVKSFTNLYLSVVSRCAAYIAGSFVAVLLVTSIIDEAILLYVHTGDHNLFWYLGILTAAYAVARSGISNDVEKANQADPEELVDRISACTHYKPVEWNGKCHTVEVRDEILYLFPYKARLFAMEMLSVILTPVVLCFSLPQCAPNILEFIRSHTAYVDGVGAVCDYSTFDLNRYGNEEFATNTKESTTLEVNARPENGKMEQSYISFQQEHPNWVGDSAGQSMIHRLKSYRAMKECQQESELSSMLQNSMSLYAGFPHRFGKNGASSSDRDTFGAVPPPGQRYGHRIHQQEGPGHTTSSPPRRRHDENYPFRHASSPDASSLSQGRPGIQNMPSVLRSILRKENIDYENDFYWLSKFQQEQRENPEGLEQSLLQSQEILQNSIFGNMSTYYEDEVESSNDDENNGSKSSSVTSV